MPTIFQWARFPSSAALERSWDLAARPWQRICLSHKRACSRPLRSTFCCTFFTSERPAVHPFRAKVVLSK